MQNGFLYNVDDKVGCSIKTARIIQSQIHFTGRYANFIPLSIPTYKRAVGTIKYRDERLNKNYYGVEIKGTGIKEFPEESLSPFQKRKSILEKIRSFKSSKPES